MGRAEATGGAWVAVPCLRHTLTCSHPHGAGPWLLAWLQEPLPPAAMTSWSLCRPLHTVPLASLPLSGHGEHKRKIYPSLDTSLSFDFLLTLYLLEQELRQRIDKYAIYFKK